jgi:CMP-N-acetylneuraminic acid synthetase
MSVVAIVPALELNKYSSHGDLSSWGDSNLLEWKISQLKNTNGIDRIVVSTDSDKIIEIANKTGVETFKRSKSLSLEDSLLHVCAKLELNDHILWANPTSPFVGQRIFSSLINEYFLHDSPVDGIVTSRVQREYLYTAAGPINCDNTTIMSRDLLPDVHMITNGAYLSCCEDVLKRGRMFGMKPFFFEVPWLASLEIRESEQMSLFSSLIQKYFQEEL